VSDTNRVRRSVIVILGPALLGALTFFALAARGDITGETTSELIAGCVVAGVLAFASSLILLGPSLKSLAYAVAAAISVYPLSFALAMSTCYVGTANCS
jgi:hypothetical protein